MSFPLTLLELIIGHIGLISSFAVACWFIFIYFPKKPKNFPPGPNGLPILGVALSIGKRPELTFLDWSKKYGDVIGFKVGNSYTVVLNSYEMIHDAYVKYAHAFSHRPNNLLFKEGLRKSGISGSDYSIDYMTQRNFAHGILGKLGFGKTAMETPILEEAKCLIARLGPGKVPLDDRAKKSIKYASGNIIAQVAFGERFSDYENPDFKTIMNAWIDFFHTGALAFNVALISPALLHLPNVKRSANAITSAMDKVMKLIQKIIAQHKETLDEDNPRDFIDEFLIEQKKSQTNTLFTDEMLQCIVRDLFGGGLESTELTLIFSCLVLANRPHIMKKVHNEIDTILGPNGKAHYSIREDMPYCQATIKEIMRFRSVGPLLIPHAVQENVKFKGYNIPKGSTILANIHAVHYSPKHWENPEEFNPDRFIDEDGKVEGGKYFLPFGIGPRLCIGRRLAEMKVFIFFVTLFQRFDVVPTPQPDCERPWVFDEVGRTGLAVNPPDHTPVTLVPRHKETI